MKKIFVLLLVVLLSASIFAGCKPATPGEILIGGIFPKSGGAATFGKSSEEGMLLAIEDFNAAGGAEIDGKKVTFKGIVEDDEGSPEKGANAAQKLINQDKVIAIVGAVMSKVSLAVAPICQSAGIPQISPTSTNPKVTEVGDYIFRACFIDPFQGTVMAKYAWENLGVKKAAVLYDNGNDYNKGLAEYFKRSFEEMGGQVVAFEAFTDEDKTVDYKAQLVNIKGKTPDFLYIPNYYGSAALIMKQSHQLGLNVPMGGGDGWDSPELVKIGGKDVEGGVFTNHFSKDDPRPEVQNFVKKYQAKYGAAPDALATLAYDATMLLLTAIKNVKSTKGSDIRDAMKNIQFDGISGRVVFDASRNPIKSAVILTIKEGQQAYVATVNP